VTTAEKRQEKKEMRAIQNKLVYLPRFRTYAIALVYVLIMGIFMITAPRAFLNYRIYMAFLSTVPFTLIMALGLTFVITAGEIDLSFPAIMAFSGYIFSLVFLATRNIILAIVCGIIVGMAIGFFNGTIIARIGVPSIIATLSSNFIWAGLAVVLSQGKQIVTSETREMTLSKIFVGRLGGIVPAQAFWALGLSVFLGFVLNRHRFGEHTMFLGDNKEAARMLGVSVLKTMTSIFMLNGLLAAFSGCLLALEMVTWWPTQGPGYLLTTVAAVFIGGTSIYGGEGTIFGTVFGAFIVGSITAGITASGIGGFWSQLVVGLVMLIAILTNTLIRKQRV
jgi:simple sugar transport system permease protein